MYVRMCVCMYVCRTLNTAPVGFSLCRAAGTVVGIFPLDAVIVPLDAAIVPLVSCLQTAILLPPLLLLLLLLLLLVGLFSAGRAVVVLTVAVAVTTGL